MSLLQMIQDVADEVGLPRPASIVGSSDLAARQLLATAHRVGNDLRRKQWPVLTRRHTITLSTGQATYALPADFDAQVFQTHWNQNKKWPLVGPLTPQEYENLVNGYVTAAISNYFRILGYTSKRITIYPTPTSSDNGQVLVFEYQSRNWIRPQEWEQGQVYTANTYTWYNGNYYTTTAGGTTGATPPTHTTGSASDGGVTWVYTDNTYDRFLADTDEVLLDEQLVGLGVQWNYLASKSLPYQHLERKYENEWPQKLVEQKGSRPVSLVQPSITVNDRFLTPETGFGS